MRYNQRGRPEPLNFSRARALRALPGMLPLALGLILASCGGASRDSSTPHDAAPRRIVSTAPSITELLFALGLGDRVVGVSTFCDYPAEAETRTRVGTFLNPNPEVILGLRPDLIIVLKNPTQLTSRLEAFGLKVLEVQQDSIADIRKTIGDIGRAAGVPGRASELNGQIEARLKEISARTALRPKRGMMFVIGRVPGSLEGLVVAAKSSYLGELMEIAGAKNIFDDSLTAYPKVTLEEVLARNPEVIVDMGDMSEGKELTGAQRRDIAALWSRYAILSAVKQKRVFPVSSDIFVVPGPRMVEAALEFARMAHPEAGL